LSENGDHRHNAHADGFDQGANSQYLESRETSQIADATDSAEHSTATTSTDGDDGRVARWWKTVLWKARFLPGIRQVADWRHDRASAKDFEIHFAKNDPADNAATRLPAGEQAHVPVLWLAELYTPMTLPGLINGIRDLMSSAANRTLPPSGSDPLEWITSTRRRGGGAWRTVGVVVPKGSAGLGANRLQDQLPPGVASVSLALYSLTRSVTVLTAGFRLQNERAWGLESILNRDFVTRAERLRPRPHSHGRAEAEGPSSRRMAG
jgi:hypothetical protein